VLFSLPLPPPPPLSTLFPYTTLFRSSYDFRGSQGEQNIFRDPLTLHPNGGEFIFNLPNGMQGYFIADAEGRRLDKAPIDIVADRSEERRVGKEWRAWCGLEDGIERTV